MSKTARLIVFVSVAAAALAAGFLLRSSTQDRSSLQPPRSVEALLHSALPDLSGQPQELAQWKGKVLVVNFWATWCPPCREEIPALIRAQERLGPRGLQVVGIAIDQADRVKPYAAEMGVNYPILLGDLDAIELARQSGNASGALPFTVVIDRSGAPIWVELGKLTGKELDQILLPVL